MLLKVGIRTRNELRDYKLRGNQMPCLRVWFIPKSVKKWKTIVDVRINETLSIHSQPPKSPTPLIRGERQGEAFPNPQPPYQGASLSGELQGTLKISRRLKLLVNVSLSLVFTINSPNLSLIGLTVAISASYTDGQNNL